MARSLRLRKPPHKYPAEDYELGPNARGIPAERSTEAETEIEPRSEASETVESVKAARAPKGNLIASRRTLKGIRAAVLQDRTNLPGGPLKVDLLLKQGTGLGIAKRSAKAARTMVESAVENDEVKEKSKNPGMATRRQLRKIETRDESSPGEDATVTARSNKENTAKKVDPTSKRATSSRIAKKSTKSARNVDGTELNEEEKGRKTSSRTVRKTSRKIVSEKEPSSSADTAEPLESKDEKSPVTDVAMGRATTNAKKPSKSTKRAPKSGKSTAKDNDAGATSYATRKTPCEEPDDRDTSVDSGLGTRDLAEQDKVPDSRTADVPTVKRPRKPAKSKKSAQTKNLNGSLVIPLSRRSALDPGRKFFKSKATDTVVRILSPVKRRAVNARRRNVGVRGNPRISVSFRSRQTTLDESFAKQAARKVLRPRAAARNYCDDTMIAPRRASKSGAEKEKTRRNVPVYKALEPQENSVNDRNEIYEFRFDSNDSREKLPTKRRRKVAATKRAKDRTGSKKKLTTGSRPRAGPKIDDAETTRSKEDNIGNATDEKSASKVPAGEAEIVLSPMDVDHGSSEPVEEPSPALPPSAHEEPDRISAKPPAKPVIVKSVELRGNDRVSLTTTPILAKTSETKPRHNLQPSKQYRTMLNHALLNKSLSPISKAIESFDPGSPWRPPTFVSQQFSRVKNIVQSTPQVRNFSALMETTDVRKNPEAITAEEESGVRTSAMKNEKERDVGERQITEKRSPSKAIGPAEAPRKFGTVISNINGASNTVEKVPESKNKGDKGQGREGVATQKVNARSGTFEQRIALTSDHATPSVTAGTTNFSNDDHSDKENSFPSPSPQRSPLKNLTNSVLNKSPLKDLNRSHLKNLNKSPLKDLNRSPLKNLNESPLKDLNRSPLKSLNKSPLKSLNRPPLGSLNKSPLKSLDRPPLESLNRSPLKSLDNLSPVKLVSQIATKEKSNTENLEPQAGPSSAQSSYPLNVSRVLRQSNLDNFLNLDEMPRSTKISTAHGIFDDAHSTPISGRPVRKVSKASDLENAFGFDDNDDSDTAISPIGKPFDVHQAAERTLAERLENAQGKTSLHVKPARLSIGDIKKHLLPIKKKERMKEQPIIERIEEEEKENRQEMQNTAAVPEKPKDDDPVNFVDTFDVLTEKAALDENSVKEVPLFTDLEPQHFKQAPRYSYKRKRVVFVLSDDDGSCDEKNEDSPIKENRVAKKRKISKVERERQERMENWAKDLNQTFEEIDHFDLVVE